MIIIIALVASAVDDYEDYYDCTPSYNYVPNSGYYDYYYGE